MKALKWNQALLEGKAETLAELAKKQECDPRYLTDLIKLAWLAPDLQNAIMAGSIPANMTLDRMKKQMPIGWSDQEIFFFGFGSESGTETDLFP